MAGVPPHRRDLNMVFQNYALFPHLSVAGNIAFGLKIANAPDIDARIRAVLAKVNLAGYEPRAVATLSGGEQQRVALARAFVNAPRVLFADEPTGNLDQTTGAKIIDLIEELNRESGTTVILVTHDEALAARATRVIRLADGIVVQDTGRAA
jgi:ABC-type Fe3+/spermidine/putrescine transport system ATPase subunit